MRSNKVRALPRTNRHSCWQGFLLFLGAGLVSPTLASAGCLDKPEHLNPTDSALASYDFEFEYKSALRKVLFKDGTDKPYFRAVSIPSFFSEWVLTVDEPTAGGAKVEVVEATKPVYKADRNYRTPPIKKNLSSIDADLARMLRAALERMLLEVRPCAHLDGLEGNDGNTYEFSAFVLTRGVLSGETWSPNEETRAARLVSIVNLLYRLTHAKPEEETQLRQDLARSVPELKREALGEDSWR
jgi:hypothetical protein